MIKMVVSDLDGTLLNDQGEISLINRNAIATLKDKGILFVIATGRPEQLVKQYVRQLEYHNDLIMYNGSVIGHPYRSTRKLSHIIDKDVLQSILEYGTNHHKLMMIYTQEAIYSNPNYRVDFFEKINQKLPEDQKAIFKPIGDDFSHLLQKDVNKVLFIERDEKSYEDMYAYLSTFQKVEIVKSQKGFIDVNPEYANKGNALRKLAEYYQIDLSEIMVIGDQENDISMIEIAGIGVAVSNASDYVKSFAKKIACSNNDHAVAFAIENLIES